MNTTLTLGKVADQAETIAIERARADLAEQRLADLREMLADMREQRDKWKTGCGRRARGRGSAPGGAGRRFAGTSGYRICVSSAAAPGDPCQAASPP